VNVEIWSDVVCPWCYIGKRRFERAVASFGHPGEVTVTYRSFELDPDAPAQRTGTDAAHLARKYGMTIAQAEQANQQMTQRAAADGKYAVSGAQEPEVLLQLLRRAYDETSQLAPVADATGSNSEASCDGDSCAAAHFH
jgi:predicted DsbA family dithiol-disulfide isomerase